MTCCSLLLLLLQDGARLGLRLCLRLASGTLPSRLRLCSSAALRTHASHGLCRLRLRSLPLRDAPCLHGRGVLLHAGSQRLLHVSLGARRLLRGRACTSTD